MSKAFSSIVFDSPSLIVWSSITSKEGASLIALTVTIKIWLSVSNPLSVTVIVNTSEPFQFKSLGVKLIVEPKNSAKIFIPSEISYIISVISSSTTTTSIDIELPSSKKTLSTLERTGASFMPSTVTVKVWDSEYSASSTVAVNDSEPFQSSSITLKVTVDPSIEDSMFVPSVIE